MAASAYMLSLLVRQYLLLTHAFKDRYPSSWLVWEPGAWMPARSLIEGDNAATRLTEHKDGARPVGSDALCFELKGGPTPKTMSVGRSSESDLFINDLTLSREHLTLHFAEGRWSISLRQQASSPASLNGKPLLMGKPQPLSTGATLTAGDVRLTWYDVQGFMARLKSEADRAAAKK